MLGTLFVVSTPIGNLGDMTFRAIATLKEVGFVFCEDTRVTRKLLDYFEIKTPVETYHQHSYQSTSNHILNLLKEGVNVAIVSDAGTPGISDPGSELVGFIRKHLDSVSIVPVPGVSAVVTALSVSGFRTDKFTFLGFPPHKNKRKKFFTEIAESKHTTVIYESSHRIEKAIKELGEVLPADTNVFIGRELTKMFETFYYGKISDVQNVKITTKGEFVIVIEKM